MTAVRMETLAEGVTLVLGDCRDVLTSIGKVDAVVTDPPYGLGDKMQGGTWGAKTEFSEMRSWDQNAPTRDVLSQIRALSPQVIFWGGAYFELPPSRCWLLWNKTNAVPTMADFEMAWTSLDRPAKRFDGTVGRILNGHPTEKPVELMVWCINQIPPPAALILDPFMGSGTTGVAAVKLGRKFIGIEIEPKYFEIAVRRISEALKQPDMFIEKPKPLIQEALNL